MAADTVSGRKSLLLIQFTREPVPGRVKTRLQPALSAQEACKVHLDLTRWTLERLLACADADVQLSVAGNPLHPAFDDYRDVPRLSIVRQADGDLGERMFTALRGGLQQYEKVLLVGSDCPQVDRHYLARAGHALAGNDVVIGPAMDGGYVLIGARAIERSLFRGVDWGSRQVFAQTRDRLQVSGMRWSTLEPRPDIDRPEDLSLWDSIREGRDAPLEGDRC